MTIEAVTGSEFLHIVISLGVLLFAARILAERKTRSPTSWTWAPSRSRRPRFARRDRPVVSPGADRRPQPAGQPRRPPHRRFDPRWAPWSSCCSAGCSTHSTSRCSARWSAASRGTCRSTRRARRTSWRCSARWGTSPISPPSTTSRQIQDALTKVENVKMVVPMGDLGGHHHLGQHRRRHAGEAAQPLQGAGRAAQRPEATRACRRTSSSRASRARPRTCGRSSRCCAATWRRRWPTWSTRSRVEPAQRSRRWQRVRAHEFWQGFDADPFGHLELLENRLAPIVSDSDMLFIRYLGTDLDSLPGHLRSHADRRGHQGAFGAPRHPAPALLRGRDAQAQERTPARQDPRRARRRPASCPTRATRSCSAS